MIVTCGQCKTRFKIPDEKVAPDKGVKVRCTRCGHTFRVTREDAGVVAAAPPAAPSGPETDPFALFGAPTPGAPEAGPGLFAPAGEAPRPPPGPPGASAPSAAFDFSRLGAPSEAAAPPAPAIPAVPAPFDFGALSAPPAAPGPGAFDFAALSGPPAAPTTSAFDFSALSAPPPPPPPEAAPVARQAFEVAPVAATTALDFSSFDEPAQGAPSPAPRRSPARPPAQPPTSPEAATRPALRPSAPGPDGFFGAPAPPPTRQPLLDLPDEVSQETARGALFEMPLELPAPPPAPSVPERARTPSRSLTQAPLARPPAAQTATAAPSRRRTALGLVVNLAIAAALVLGVLVVGSALLNEGNLSRESLSLDALRASFVPASDFVATDISNGLYLTRAGRSVFFVRGEVQNRSSTPARVAVRAEIIEGAAVLRSARALAGAVPSPEELFNLPDGQAQEDLSRKLAGRAAQVPPGGSAEFLITFTEYPPDLKALRVRVSAQAEAPGTAARPR
jgi:predicted Zn finger-like uncharacterized protein